jgi:hypothetical protein
VPAPVGACSSATASVACVRSAAVTSSTPSPATERRSTPLPLVVAAVLTGVEALALVGLAVAELAALSGSKATMGVTTSLFFLLYGAGLGVAAWSLYRLRSWARAPIVLTQLIQLGVAWSFRGGSSGPVAAALAVVAVVVLGGILNPVSLRAVDSGIAPEDE